MDMIRPAGRDDYPAIARLRAQMQAQHEVVRPDYFSVEDLCIDEKEFAKMLKPRKFTWLVAEDTDKRVVGYALCVRAGKALVLDEMCVDESYRGQGIGTQMMDALKDLATQTGADSLELEVWECNPAAARFYERCGMAVQRRRMEWPTHETNMQ